MNEIHRDTHTKTVCVCVCVRVQRHTPIINVLCIENKQPPSIWLLRMCRCARVFCWVEPIFSVFPVVLSPVGFSLVAVVLYCLLHPITTSATSTEPALLLLLSFFLFIIIIIISRACVFYIKCTQIELKR